MIGEWVSSWCSLFWDCFFFFDQNENETLVIYHFYLWDFCLEESCFRVLDHGSLIKKKFGRDIRNIK